MPYKDPAKERAWRKAWRAKNVEKCRAYHKRWRANHKELCYQYERRYMDSIGARNVVSDKYRKMKHRYYLTRKKKMSKIQINDTITVKIIQLNEEGDGLGKYENYVVFIPDTLPGDQVEAIVKRISGNILYSEIVRRIQHENKINSNI